MKIDLLNCEIRTPTGEQRLPVYRLLREIFPTDSPLITELIEQEDRFPHWPCHVLYRGEEALGSVWLAGMRVWLEGRSTELVGIAWVATREEYRRQGVAKRLLRHALEAVDQRVLPSVLFTGQPGVYRQLGFGVLPQIYLATTAGQLASGPVESAWRIHETLTPSLVEMMARIYAETDSNHNGKVVRDREYWRLYRALFNGNRNVRLLVDAEDGPAAGYVRIETEKDRLLVPEICFPAAAPDVARALFGRVAELATDGGRQTITLALAGDHPAMRNLRLCGVTLEPEPPGARRETFMVRAPRNRSLGPLEQLQWPLCDKF